MDVIKKEVGDVEGIADTGLCVGVEVARRGQHKVADEHGDDSLVYSLRPDVEFDSYGREDLEQKGIQISDDLDDEIDAEKAVIGVRGAPPQVRDQIDESDTDLVYDTTCPYVVQQEQAASDILRDGRHLIFLSDPDHHGVERLRGIAEEEDQELYIVQHPEQIDKIELGRHAPVGVVVQTTFWMKTYKSIVNRLLGEFEDILIRNTACEDSLYRLPELEKLVDKVDGVVVVGWSQGMVHRMQEVADAYETPICNVDPVETPTPLGQQLAEVPRWDADRVGVIAANVTPDDMVEEVVSELESLEPDESTVPQ
jgi:(E)-4-hydroxy-3-methyl-but-2-enyl pyrophosphate reductase